VVADLDYDGSVSPPYQAAPLGARKATPIDARLSLGARAKSTNCLVPPDRSGRLVSVTRVLRPNVDESGPCDRYERGASAARPHSLQPVLSSESNAYRPREGHAGSPTGLWNIHRTDRPDPRSRRSPSSLCAPGSVSALPPSLNNRRPPRDAPRAAHRTSSSTPRREKWRRPQTRGERDRLPPAVRVLLSPDPATNNPDTVLTNDKFGDSESWTDGHHVNVDHRGRLLSWVRPPLRANKSRVPPVDLRGEPNGKDRRERQRLP
jgi:hypothetical protein